MKLKFLQNDVDRVNYLDLTREEVNSALCLLSELLYIHFGRKTLVLVDEYDASINSAYMNLSANQHEVGRIVDLHRGVLATTFKGNEHLDKGLVTGVLRVAKANIFSGLNNLGEFGIGDAEFAPYYGFTQVEVEELMLRYDIPKALAAGIKSWYNGYDVAGLEIYNPWSVIEAVNKYQVCVRSGIEPTEEMILRNYWKESGSLQFIAPLLRYKGVIDDIRKLSLGKEIPFVLKRQIGSEDFEALREMSDLSSNYVVTKSGVNVIFSYLFAAGYLTLNGMKGFYRAPNKEVEEAFKERLLIHYDAVYSLSEGLFRDVTDQLQRVFDANEDVEYKEAAVGIRNTLGKLFAAMPEFSKFDRYSIDDSDEEMLHGNEDLVHTILNYIALQLPGMSHFGTEVYLGKGRADMVLLDKEQSKALIVELKYDQGSAAGALRQIKDSGYSGQFLKGIKLYT